MKERSIERLYEARGDAQAQNRPTHGGEDYRDVPTPGDNMADLERAERLREARQSAGYSQAVDAATAFGWNESTYWSHENGNRGLTRDALARYTTAFRVRVDWLAYGQGPMRIGSRRIRIEGLVGDLVLIEQQEARLEAIGEIELPEGINPDEFAAFRVADTSNPAVVPGDVVLVPRQHGAPEEYIGWRCLVTLKDGSRVIRTLLKGGQNGLFGLFAAGSALPPLLDIEIVDAAPILWIMLGGG